MQTAYGQEICKNEGTSQTKKLEIQGMQCVPKFNGEFFFVFELLYSKGRMQILKPKASFLLRKASTILQDSLETGGN